MSVFQIGLKGHPAEKFCFLSSTSLADVDF